MAGEAVDKKAAKRVEKKASKEAAKEAKQKAKEEKNQEGDFDCGGSNSHCCNLVVDFRSVD